jgi:UDP-GlcNAc:undecaprenyl-phosphate GlcNAc-1-phosphate transferase
MMLFDLMSLKIWLGIGAAWLFTYYLIPLCIKLAIHLNIVDKPDGKLKQHEQITPYLGGVALFGGLLVGSACCDIAWPASLMCGMSMLLMLGIVDDSVSLSPLQKIAWQWLAAVFISRDGGMIARAGCNVLSSWGCNEGIALFLGIFLEIIFIMTITNAYNLIDIMDGLAAITALGSSVMLIFVAMKMGCSAAALKITLYAAALIAFLRYNLPRARIYLGDAGSLMMGGFLAGMACQIPWYSIMPSPPLVSFISMAFMLTTIFFIPFLELMALIVIRTRKHIPFFLGSPHHFIHYLKSRSFSIPSILIVVCAMSMVLLLNLVFLLSNLLSVLQSGVMTAGLIAAWLVFIYQIPRKGPAKACVR